ncbi:MAG: IS5 family transposase [Candidatus Omnitrophica bacterium]|nr:IS5 family transposase [Candidatus Omnitrophota bacterium]NUP93698.1 IS5 family transposase [Candidatus Omnitrophota bacterium]
MWERIEGLIPVPTNTHPRGGGRKRVPYRTVMNGIFFVLRTGCQWKALDATGICSGSTAHARLQEWTQAGVFEGLWQMALEDYDELKGIDWKWVCMDGAITKSPLGGEKTGPNPTDRAKEGTKRSLVCDGSGIPLGVCVEGANRHDMKTVEETLESILAPRPQPTEEQPQNLCLDKGYDYDEVRDLVEEFGFTAHIRTRGEEARLIKEKAGFKARRWVVERTHSWMNRFRRIFTRWEKKAENYLGMLHLVCAIITIRQLIFG